MTNQDRTRRSRPSAGGLARLAALTAIVVGCNGGGCNSGCGSIGCGSGTGCSGASSVEGREAKLTISGASHPSCQFDPGATVGQYQLRFEVRGLFGFVWKDPPVGVTGVIVNTDSSTYRIEVPKHYPFTLWVWIEESANASNTCPTCASATCSAGVGRSRWHTRRTYWFAQATYSLAIDADGCVCK